MLGELLRWRWIAHLLKNRNFERSESICSVPTVTGQALDLSTGLVPRNNGEIVSKNDILKRHIVERRHFIFGKSKRLTMNPWFPWDSGVENNTKSSSGSGRVTPGPFVDEFRTKANFDCRTTSDWRWIMKSPDVSTNTRPLKSLNWQKAPCFLSFFKREKSIKLCELVPWNKLKRFPSNDIFFIFHPFTGDDKTIDKALATDEYCGPSNDNQLLKVLPEAVRVKETCDTSNPGFDLCGRVANDLWTWTQVVEM